MSNLKYRPLPTLYIEACFDAEGLSREYQEKLIKHVRPEILRLARGRHFGPVSIELQPGRSVSVGCSLPYYTEGLFDRLEQEIEEAILEEEWELREWEAFSDE